MLGVGGQAMIEPSVIGNRHAPHITPGTTYEGWIRGELIENFEAEEPNLELDLPDPEATSALSYKAIGYLGFGGWGPLVWNNAYVSYSQIHPENTTTEEDSEGNTHTLYITDLTDERIVFVAGNEMLIRVIPNRVDLVWGALYGNHEDGDNSIVPTDHDRTYASTVLRTQVYLTQTVHLLGETSVAREFSKNGNAYREHSDSIFANTAGSPDTDGLETGDTDTRETWQGKTGFVFNPLGPGIYSRPSLRLLYGAQLSNQNNAYGNSFIETIDQFNEFDNFERHWHHVVALEMEAWF